MIWKLLTLLAAAVMYVPLAVSQPRVTVEIGAPYIPEGLVLRETSDCQIASSGGPPDAHLRCAPGLGWRLLDAATDAVIYPTEGYLRRDLEWAFAGPEAVAFLQGSDLKIVRLPSGEVTEMGTGDLEQFRDAEGLGFRAVVWTLPRGDNPSEAFILRADGSLSAPVAGADMRQADWTRGLGCRPAVVLAALGAENMPNSIWSKIVRRSAAEDGVDLCETIHEDRLAGLGDDGLWRALDPSNFKANGTGAFGTAAEALGE